MNQVIGNKPRIFSILFLLMLNFILMAAPIWAEDAGDGSGGGQGVPLGLVSSIPADGAKNVALDTDIKLTFNKNVIYLAIRDNNKKCFSLVAADGIKVPIEVIMADDQIHPEEKRNIGIHPLQEFEPGKGYTLKIAPQFQAKNGDTLGREVTVSFVTAGTAVKPAPIAPTDETVKPAEESKPAPKGENNEVQNTIPTPVAPEKTAAVAEQKTSGVENAPVAEDKTIQAQDDKQVKQEEKTPVKENTQEEQKPNRTYAILAGLILLAGAGYLQVRKRKQRQ